MKRALITGITGQDGAYLADFLIRHGYEVHGLVRRSSTHATERIDHLLQKYPEHLFLHHGDMIDAGSVLRVMLKVVPDEIYNLAAQSHVAVSFEVPVYTAQVSALGLVHLVEAARQIGIADRVRIYQASSSELFGKVQEVPQKETTPFYPRSPYAVAKLYAYWMVVNYREAYNIFVCNGILFNHESPLRGETFVTKKIVQALARIAAGKQERLLLGNLDAQRDWGFAGDYVRAMWLMLQQQHAEDFVIATGEQHTVRHFVVLAAQEIGITLVWRGSGKDEVGIDAATGKVIIAVDEQFFRPTEVDCLLGDASKAKERLGWQPTTSFPELVRLMMQAELSSQANTMRYSFQDTFTHEQSR